MYVFSSLIRICRIFKLLLCFGNLKESFFWREVYGKEERYADTIKHYWHMSSLYKQNCWDLISYFLEVINFHHVSRHPLFLLPHLIGFPFASKPSLVLTPWLPLTLQLQVEVTSFLTGASGWITSNLPSVMQLQGNRSLSQWEAQCEWRAKKSQDIFTLPTRRVYN